MHEKKRGNYFESHGFLILTACIQGSGSIPAQVAAQSHGGSAMKARILLMLLGLTVPLNLKAQNRVDVFAGYSFLGYYTYQAYTGPWTLNDYSGFEASAAYRLVPHLAAEADFSFENGPQKIQTYMGGPRVSIGYGKADFFAHGLFGGLRDATSAGGSNTTFVAAWRRRRLSGQPPLRIAPRASRLSSGEQFFRRIHSK